MREPAEVKVATAGYRDEQDLVASWLAECCLLSPNANTRAGELYGSYKRWHEGAGEQGKPISQRKFGEALGAREFKSYTSNGTWYRGIALARHDDVFPD
jgi:putative DNA primase/helicase